MQRGPWIFSRGVDLAVFVGAAGLALGVAALGPWLSPDGSVPTWTWIAFVLALDVAHVWTTIFRTYLDREELRRRRRLYLLTPIACYTAGVAVHGTMGPLVFWRVLAYAAVFHFIRQQVGWVAIYRVRNGERAPVDRRVDEAVIYCATGVPVLYWHCHLPRGFEWFVAGDFVDLGRLAPGMPVAWAVYGGAAVAYVWRATVHHRAGRTNWGKHGVVAATAVIWMVGIVLANDDFTFTVTNVTVHAVPYFALLWFYARERAPELKTTTLLARLVGVGVGAFLAVALGLAFLEELLWERLVWHDRPGWFGGALRDEPWLGPTALTWVVPLLSLPQVVHYVLDGVLWRAKDAGPAQARALGFAPRWAAPPRPLA